MKAYLVCTLTQQGVTTAGNLDMSWADGMIGAMPVFSYRKYAKKYAKGSTSEIWELEIPEITL